MPVEAVSLYPLVILERLAQPGPRKYGLLSNPPAGQFPRAPTGTILDPYRGTKPPFSRPAADRIGDGATDLDALIDRAGETTPVDEIMMRRLKKRRLALKDEMARLQSLLSPDEPA